jgi:hypothetical protein
VVDPQPAFSFDRQDGEPVIAFFFAEWATGSPIAPMFTSRKTYVP